MSGCISWSDRAGRRRMRPAPGLSQYPVAHGPARAPPSVRDMSESKVRHFQDWWKAKFGFVPHGDRVVCTLCHKSIVTRTSSVRRHFNTKHGPLIPPSSRSDYIRRCVAAFENMQPRPDLIDTRQHRASDKRSPSPDSKICLRWNTYHTNIQTIFPALLSNEQFVDVTLACEGRFMKCHKVILSACSPYFEELLSQNPCQHPIVFMKDIKFWEVRALVEFMYSGEVNVAEEKLPSLLRAAEALQVKGLTSAPTSTNNDSADSEDIPFDKVKEIPSSKASRRKRKLSDSIGKSNGSSPNDLLPENKLLREERSFIQSSSGLNSELNSQQTHVMIGSSNHPPIDNQNSEFSGAVGNKQNTRVLESNIQIKDEQFTEESSQESDSEQENYTFNMAKRPVADHGMNLRRQTRWEGKLVNRVQDEPSIISKEKQ